MNFRRGERNSDSSAIRADSGSKPPLDDVAHHSEMISPTFSEMMSPIIRG
jgi:hypothetical protein